MVKFLIRRTIQALIVLLMASIVSYGLLYLSPGGPLVQFQQMQRGGPQGPDEEDLQRIRERFELDLFVPVRFTRWLVGFPDGPVSIGGQTFFADQQVGCRPGDVRYRYADGREQIVREDCVVPVTLADLEGRRVSNGALFGDFGLSQTISRDRPVSEVIGSRLWYTLALMGISTLIALLIAIPMGIYSAVRQYSRFDYTMTTTAFIGASLPTFFFGFMAILFLSVYAQRAGLPFLPAGGATSNRDTTYFPGLPPVEAGSLLDLGLHFILPCAVLAFVSIATWSRFIRASMLEVLGQDYVRTARSKGLAEKVVILKHSFRNALIPFITLFANILPALFAGAAVTEAVFGWPGLGSLLVRALNTNDYNVVMALLYITIVLQLVGYIISDIMYTIADPRIRVS